MSALSIRLPNSLHERVRQLAAREGISINQLVASALAEKMAALLTADYLEARARRGSRAKFLAALTRVPDDEPDPWDRFDFQASAKRMQPASSRKRASRSSRVSKSRPRG